MFKNFPHLDISKQNVVIRTQAKHLLNVNSLEVIWRSFLIIIMNKLENFYFTCPGTGFLVFLSFLHRKLPIQICFCKVAGENGKKLLQETFLSYQTGTSSMNVFVILQLSRSVGLHRKWFSGESRERKPTLLQETQADQIF